MTPTANPASPPRRSLRVRAARDGARLQEPLGLSTVARMDDPAEERQRCIALTGATNFRDLGGYPTANGGRTKWRLVFRSDALHRLTHEDVAAVQELGVRTVFDLRRQEECDREPGPLPAVHLELPSQNPLDVADLRSRRDGERWLLEDYLHMLASGATVFGRLFGFLADADDGVAVFHCAGGKDRTGMAAALLLAALGVDRQVVLDDYELTNRYRGVDHVPQVVDLFADAGIARAAAEGMLSAPRWAMEEALLALDERYGGIESYLAGPGRMEAESLTALRRRLVA